MFILCPKLHTKDRGKKQSVLHSLNYSFKFCIIVAFVFFVQRYNISLNPPCFCQELFGFSVKIFIILGIRGLLHAVEHVAGHSMRDISQMFLGNAFYSL